MAPHRSGTAPGSAGAVVMAVLHALTDEVDVLLPGALADEPDAVHQARIGVRRLRCALRCHRDLFEPEPVQRLRDQLHEVGAVLGEVRDLEVRIDLVEQRVTAIGDADLRSTLIAVDRDRRAAALARLPGALAEAGDWRRDLARFLADPPLRHRARRGPRKEMRRAVVRQTTWLRGGAWPEASDLDGLHLVRRRARRLRYAAEAVTLPPAEAFGKRMRTVGAAAKEVQDLLGDHRDLVLLADHLRSAPPGSWAARGEELAATAEADAATVLAAVPRAVRHTRRRVAQVHW